MPDMAAQVVSHPNARLVAAPRRWLAGFAAAVLVLGAAWFVWPTVAAEAHAARATVHRAVTLAALSGRPRLTTPYFTVYYPQGDLAQAQIVASAADSAYPRVARDFGIAASGRHPLVVATASEMQRVVGTAVTAPPLGLYECGVIWLLEPAAFLPAGPGLATEYATQGPVTHELTHLANDLDSAGRDPVWLDEAIAQYEDWRLTGYVWVAPDSGFGGATYTLAQLEGGFYALPNQALAFHQAFAAATLLCGQAPGVCVQILHLLGDGRSLSQAVTQAAGPRAAAALADGAAWPAGWTPPWPPRAAPAP